MQNRTGPWFCGTTNPSWESSYTLNTNLQMNYWMAEPANLAECHRPLIRMIHQLAASGNTTARRMYGAEGWVAHHNSDLWCRGDPADAPAESR